MAAYAEILVKKIVLNTIDYTNNTQMNTFQTEMFSYLTAQALTFTGVRVEIMLANTTPYVDLRITGVSSAGHTCWTLVASQAIINKVKAALAAQAHVTSYNDVQLFSWAEPQSGTVTPTSDDGEQTVDITITTEPTNETEMNSILTEIKSKLGSTSTYKFAKIGSYKLVRDSTGSYTFAVLVNISSYAGYYTFGNFSVFTAMVTYIQTKILELAYCTSVSVSLTRSLATPITTIYSGYNSEMTWTITATNAENRLRRQALGARIGTALENIGAAFRYMWMRLSYTYDLTGGKTLQMIIHGISYNGDTLINPTTRDLIEAAVESALSSVADITSFTSNNDYRGWLDWRTS